MDLLRLFGYFFFAIVVVLLFSDNCRRVRSRVKSRQYIRECCESRKAPKGGWIARLDLETGKLEPEGSDPPPIRSVKFLATSSGNSIMDRCRERASGGWLDLELGSPLVTHAGYVTTLDDAVWIAARPEE